MTCAPTAASHDPTFIDVFAVTSTGDMFQTATQNAGLNWTQWSNWGHPAGYTILGKPTLTSWGASRLDFYVTAKPTQGITNALFHRIWDDGVDSGWQQVNTGTFIPGTAPGAASWGPSNVVLTVLAGAPANLWVGTSSDGQTFTWTAAGNNGYSLDVNAAPDVGSHDESTADVFMTDVVGNLKHYWIANGATGWDSLGNSGTPVKAGTGPAVVGRGDQRLIVSYTGNDNSVWQREYDYGWKSWVRTLWPNGTYKDGDISSW